MTDNRRLRHAMASYTETLAATKHQDDKIGRFLTAIAFLIAAALVFINTNVLQARYRLEGHLVPLPAIALVSFLVLVVLASLLYLLAMGAPLTIPGPRARSHDRHSHLFFLVIARESRDSWQELWKGSDDELEQQLSQEYVEESQNIAYRALRKVERSNEATALFILALLAFLLAVVLSVHVLLNLEPAADPALPFQPPESLGWSLPLRGLIAAILTSFTGALVYERLRATQDVGALVDHGGTGWGPLHWLLISYSAFIPACLLPDRGSRWAWVGVGLTAAASVAAAAAFGRLLSGRRSRARIVVPVVGATVAAGAAGVYGLTDGGAVWQLAVAVAAAVSPMAPSAAESSIALRGRLRRWSAPRAAG